MKRLHSTPRRPALSLVREGPQPTPSPRRPRPIMPRGCVRIYPVLGGYMAVAFDRAGEARREVRCTREDWESPVGHLEEWLRSIGELLSEPSSPPTLTVSRGGLR